MLRCLSHCVVLAVLVAVLPVQAASARSLASHRVYRHQHGHVAVWHHYRRGSRRLYAVAPPQDFAAPFAAGFGMQQPQWRAPAYFASYAAAPSSFDGSRYGSFGTGYAPGRRRAGAVAAYSGMAAAQASANGVPLSLIERVIARESGGNARAVSRGNYGLMQIRLSTARAMGYTGSAAGLLDPAVNMTYAVRYLAGAYRAAGGNESRAVALYARGYYAQAKAQGFSPYASAQAMNAPRFTEATWTAPFGAPAFAGEGYRVRHYYRRHAV